MCGLPKLIAACHVLLRLFLPRHPPCALSSLTIELTLAQELIPTSNLDKRGERGSSRQSSIALNRRHVSCMFGRQITRRITPSFASRTYPKDTQLNNLLYSGIRIQAQGVAQPCNLFTQSISLSNIQSPASLTPTLRWIEPASREYHRDQPCSKVVIRILYDSG